MIETILHRRPGAVEAIEHARPERPAMGDHGGVVDVTGLAERLAARLGLREQTLFNQDVEADKQRIARKCGKALVRRVAVACRPERQHLPQPLAG